MPPNEVVGYLQEVSDCVPLGVYLADGLGRVNAELDGRWSELACYNEVHRALLSCHMTTDNAFSTVQSLFNRCSKYTAHRSSWCV